DWVNAGGRDVTRFTASARGFASTSLIAQINNNGMNALASAQPVVPAIAGSIADAGAVRTASAEVPRSNQVGKLNQDGGSYYLNELRSREASGDNSKSTLASAGISSPTGLPTVGSSEIAGPVVVANEKPNQFVPLNTNSSQSQAGIQHSVSQPRPLQTLGGVLQRSFGCDCLNSGKPEKLRKPLVFLHFTI
ncbi:MAG: hypothetical protein ACK5T6_15475, partial [Pirellula sp.]